MEICSFTLLYSCTSVTHMDYDDVTGERHICVILITRFLRYFAQTMRIQSTVEMATKPKMGGGRYSVTSGKSL